MQSAGVRGFYADRDNPRVRRMILQEAKRTGPRMRDAIDGRFR